MITLITLKSNRMFDPQRRAAVNHVFAVADRHAEVLNKVQKQCLRAEAALSKLAAVLDEQDVAFDACSEASQAYEREPSAVNRKNNARAKAHLSRVEKKFAKLAKHAYAPQTPLIAAAETLAAAEQELYNALEQYQRSLEV